MKWTEKICLLIVSLVLICFEVMCVAAAEKGLVAHYSFDKGKGTAVVDVSGHGNDGKIIGGVKWVRGPFGYGLGSSENRTRRGCLLECRA